MNKLPYEYDEKQAPIFLIMYWLSREPKYLPIIEKINPYLFYLPQEKIFRYLYDTIPYGFRFLKSNKKMKKDLDKNIVDVLQLKYKMSNREILETIKKLEGVN